MDPRALLSLLAPIHRLLAGERRRHGTAHGWFPAFVQRLENDPLLSSCVKTKAIRPFVLMLGVCVSAGAWIYGGQRGLLGAPPAGRPAEPPAVGDKSKKAPASARDRFGDPLPEGAIARLGTVRLRAVSARLGLSSDGKTIITVGGGRQVKFWEPDSGKLRQSRELPLQTGQPFFLSRDGRLLAVRELDMFSTLDIWDVTLGKRLHRLPQEGGIYRAAFSPDGKLLAISRQAAPKDAHVCLWDLSSVKQRDLKGFRRSPDNLAFSPDGKLLAASDGQSVICWNRMTGEQLWQTKCAFGISLGFTPDGRTLIASAGNREPKWHAWEAATGKPHDGLKLPEGYHYAEFAVAPDGRTLVFAQRRSVQGADGRVRLWDLQTGKLLHTLKAEGQIGPFFPDGKSFLTNEGTLQRWDLANGKPLLPDTNQLGHSSEVARAVYSPDGRRLASSARDGSIRLWDVATARPLHILRGHDAYALAFTSNGKLLVSGGTDGELFIWDTEAGKEVRRIPLYDGERAKLEPNVLNLHLTQDSRTVFVLRYKPDRQPIFNGILSSWDVATGQRKTQAETGPSDGLYSAFSPDGRTLASRGELLDTATGKPRAKLEGAAGSFAHYAFAPDGRFVAGLVTHMVREGQRISTKMDGIQIWDAATGRALRRIQTDWVGQLAFSPDGRYLAAGDLEGLRLWELDTGEVVMRHKAHERIRGSYGSSFASCLSFAPDGRSLATGHLDSTVLIWNLVPSARPAADNDLPGLWEDLAGSDASRAYAASWRLVDAPKEAIRFLQARLRPVSAAPAERVRALLTDLDGDDFAKREEATARLRELDDRAAGFLREAIKTHPSLEMRRRVEELLSNLEKSPTKETLRALRALAVLERIGTAEARQLLKTLAQGLQEARITREAKVSLQRLDMYLKRETK